jgi:DNA gyrase inhibitor GyrI
MNGMSTTPGRVEIVRLEAMRVASAYGYGENPEEIAWRKLAQWAKPKGFLDDITAHPIFGFNNPYPTPANSRHGYEFWIKVGADVEPEGEIRIGEFFGGMYAVSRCRVQGHPENIPAAWKSLGEWCSNSGHTLGTHHALERFLSSPENFSNLELDLCCPIRG